jgi:hypothetical protein
LGHYSGIFAWDSAWHYFFLKEIDASRAVAELETLFSTQDEDGRVPHETRFEAPRPHGVLRRVQLQLLSDTYASDGRSRFVDPPVYAWAAADAVREGLVEGEEGVSLLQRAGASLSYFRRARTLPELAYPFNELPLILHPLESGTDGSPQFDEIYGGSLGTVAAMVRLGGRLKRLGWDPLSAVAAGIAGVFDITVVSFYILGLQSVIAAAHQLAESQASRVLRSLPSAGQVEELAAATRGAFRNDRHGLYTSRRLCKLDDEPRQCETATLSGLLPLLWSGGDRTAVEMLRNHGAPEGTFFSGELPRYTVGPRAQGGRAHGDRRGATGRRERLSRLLWRGPCSWMNMNYCLWIMLRTGGFENDASLLADRAAEAVRRLGPWEYLHAQASTGGGAYPFSWNGLILPMLGGD